MATFQNNITTTGGSTTVQQGDTIVNQATGVTNVSSPPSEREDEKTRRARRHTWTYRSWAALIAFILAFAELIYWLWKHS